MSHRDQLKGAYIPDFIPEDDLQYFVKSGGWRERGVGRAPAVLVVDMTHQFVSDAYPLGRADVAQPCVAAIATLLAFARQRSWPIYYTRAVSPANLGGPPPERAYSNAERFPEGNQIVPELAPQPGDRVVEKSHPSAFFGTPLDSRLRFDGVDTLVVTGMSTSGCVRGTVLDAHSLNFRVLVPIECVADRSTVSHQVSLFDMSMKYADVVALKRALTRLNGLARNATA